MSKSSDEKRIESEGSIFAKPKKENPDRTISNWKELSDEETAIVRAALNGDPAPIAELVDDMHHLLAEVERIFLHHGGVRGAAGDPSQGFPLNFGAGDSFRIYWFSKPPRQIVLDAHAIAQECTLALHDLADGKEPSFLRGRAIGRLEVKINVRWYEYVAKLGFDLIERAKRLCKRKKSPQKKLEAIDAIKSARRTFPHRGKDLDFLKEKAAEELGITKRALNMRLKK